MDSQTLTVETVLRWLEQVSDPEVPVLTILDLGIVRNVHIPEPGTVAVTITPTYSGCPAMDVISMQIRMVLAAHGVRKVVIDQQLSPAWTTDWMTESGRQKLKAYGIAPPQYDANRKRALFEEDTVPCPHCDSTDTKLISGFGSTSCKSQYQCNHCHEPFEHFKCH
jgi:ring-1,2-phenylacetyl-CoA epoxidase subunit PaaD